MLLLFVASLPTSCTDTQQLFSRKDSNSEGFDQLHYREAATNGSTAQGWNATVAKVGDDSLQNVFFVNSTHGWVTGIRATFSDGNSHVGVISSNLFKTVDAGNSWSKIDLEIASGSYVSQVFFVDENVGWLIVQKPAKPNQGRSLSILHSVDGGLSWKETYKRDNFLASKITFDGKGHGWLVGSREYAGHTEGLALYSTNFGVSWADVYMDRHSIWSKSSTPQPTRSAVADVIPLSPANSIVLLANGAVVSVKFQGSQWLAETLREKTEKTGLNRFSRNDGTFLISSAARKSGQVWSTFWRGDDDRTTFETRLDGVYTTDLFSDSNFHLVCGYKLSMISTDSQTTQLAQSAVVLYSRDGGRSWEQVYELMGPKSLVRDQGPGKSPNVKFTKGSQDSDGPIRFFHLFGVGNGKYFAVGDSGIIVTLTAPY
jgi:hypothetical protein